MGVTGFLQFIKTKYPSLIDKEHISLYAYERVFIDISGYLYRYICSHGKQNHRWIYAMLTFMNVFKENRVIPVPVFDGKPPSEKADEISTRREKRSQHQERIVALETALNKYANGDRSPEVLAALQSELDRLEQRGQRMVRLLPMGNSSARSKITPSDITLLCDTLQTLTKQHIYITDEDTKMLKDIFTACGISWIQSPSESESFCSFLIRKNAGSAVVSCDSDCLAHLVPDLILDLDLSGNCTRIELSDLLSSIELTESQLIDYAILMGCDYNRHIKKNKLGPVNALKLIHQHGTIEQIPEGTIDKECLLYQRCRELFQPSFDMTWEIPIFKPDQDKMKEWSDKLGMDYHLFSRLSSSPTISAQIRFVDEVANEVGESSV